MNDSQSDALDADELDADGLEAWLSDLPFWGEVDARHEFVDDLLWQLGVDNDSGCTGQPDYDPSGVADAGYAVCPDADPAAAAAAVVGLCATAADASASDVLLASVLDRGVDIDMPFRVAPLAGLSGDATPAHGASLREPYPGPRAFQVVDAPIFFGRGLETRQLLRLLAPGRAARLVIVAGRSGSGKTSLVQAGLLAGLSRGGAPGLKDSQHWPVAMMRLTEQADDPVDLLAGALTASGATIPGSNSEIAAGLRGDGSTVANSQAGYLLGGLADRPAGACWLFVVDGLGQLLRPRVTAHRSLWFDLLRHLLSMPRVRVVATLRSEFLDACVEVPLLRHALNRGGLLALPTPSRQQLKWMLRAPLLRAGAAVPEGMDAAMIDALAAEAMVAPVPLLNLAARARMACRQAAVGAVPPRFDPHCFDDWCDAALLDCGDADAEVLPRVLSRLVQVEQTGGAFRQSALLEAWHADPAARRLIDALSRDERPLLRVDDATVPTVGLAHDGLLQAWRRLDNNAWWSGLKRRPREGWNAERRGNYPATRLSWHDATALCRWLGARLGLDVRLPEEWEWQWAAQSAREDFVYPWGRDWLPARANTDEAGIGRTMAVGMYPAGQSLQGVSDLAGNTWEWCRGGFELSGEQRGRGAAAERGARVIRGGSWRVNRGFARADFRLDAMPEDRVGSTGFRVACSVDGADVG